MCVDNVGNAFSSPGVPFSIPKGTQHRPRTAITTEAFSTVWRQHVEMVIVNVFKEITSLSGVC